jgi:WD40 repeat protein
VWDARTGELQRIISEMKLAMFTMAYSPDGKYLATAGADRTIYLWDTQSWKTVRQITGQPETIRAIRFSPDGTLLVTGGMNELNFASPVKVVLWDFASGRQLHSWTAEHMVQGLAFSPDGKRVAVADGTKSVKLLAVRNMARTSKL